MTAVLLAVVAEGGGDAAVGELLRVSGSDRSRRFLEHTENWISLDEAMALLAAAVEVTGDPDAPRRIGARTVQQHAGTPVSTMFRSLGSPEAILSAVTATAGKFSTVTEMSSIENEPGRCVVRAAARPGFERRLLHCQWAQGLLSTGPTLFGLPLARVHEESCQARGDAECRYVVTWDAAQAAAGADPHERVTALEAQLMDTQARLVSVYQSARELLSAEDVDVVLARVVERAAQTVRAPRFLLTVPSATSRGRASTATGSRATRRWRCRPLSQVGTAWRARRLSRGSPRVAAPTAGCARTTSTPPTPSSPRRRSTSPSTPPTRRPCWTWRPPSRKRPVATRT